MVAGLQSKKVGFIIQARMKSSRLPGKILLPIPLHEGKPLLSWIADELKKSSFDNEIIVATSTTTDNDTLVAFCEREGLNFFRGDEEDVLSRFTSIVKSNNFNCIVRLTADNPLIDIKLLDKTIEKHLNEGNDYTKTEALPLGMNFEVVAPGALLDTELNELTPADKEHVTLYIKKSDKYKKEVYSPDVPESYKNIRLTVDYPSDFALMSAIFNIRQNEPGLEGLTLVDKVFSDFPWLFEINNSNLQKRQFKTTGEELEAAVLLLELYDFKHASGILNKHAQGNLH